MSGKLLALSVLGAFALIGCASTKSKTSANVAAPAGEGVILGAIPESNIPKGSCGMVLWTLAPDRPTPVFRYVAGKGAELVIAGAPVTLTLTTAGGGSAYGVSEEQAFSSVSGDLRVTTKARFGSAFDGGAYLERGIVAVESTDGWRTVIPSAGLAGCRAK